MECATLLTVTWVVALYFPCHIILIVTPKQMFDTPIKDRESVVAASDYADELQELLLFYEAGTELSHQKIQYFVDSIVENLNASLGVDVPV